MKKPAFWLAALALSTTLLGACDNKSGGDGDSTAHGSPGSDTTNPESKTTGTGTTADSLPRATSPAAPR